MKKIMIIDGGPRKGMNTAQMVDYKDAHWEQDLQKSRKAGKRMAEEIYEKIDTMKTMKHKVKVTVIDKKLYPELQQQYCADPNSGMCPCYNVGDEFIFERDEQNDHFWHGGLNTLVKTAADPNTVAGGPKIPHCSEAWDAISRYIYTGLQGGSIMKGWMKYENEMICCCSDGTRPVIFKVERIDEE